MLAPCVPVPNHQPPSALIFDIDGTLIDSNDAHARSWRDMLAESGQRASYDRIRHMIGMGGDKVLPALTGIREDSEAGQEMARRRLEIFKLRYLPYLHPFPGARTLALRMREDGIRLFVATSASGELLDRLLEIAEVRDLIEQAASKDDADRTKPDPDIVRAALARAGEPPDRVLMIGDTPYDIEAADRAGVRTIALRCGGGWSEQDLAGADAIFDDPLDLLINYDDSPLVGRGEWVPVAVRAHAHASPKA
jgi:phosphoglycolate phosphatase-like HAD superfamily hydrolase